MKICISVITYFPEQNGVQFVTQNLAEGLVKNGHEVTVLTRSSRKYRNDENVNGVKVIRCNIKDKNMFHFGNKKEFQNKCTNEYTLEQIQNIEEVRTWLKNLLATNQ